MIFQKSKNFLEIYSKCNAYTSNPVLFTSLDQELNEEDDEQNLARMNLRDSVFLHKSPVEKIYAPRKKYCLSF